MRVPILVHHIFIETCGRRNGALTTLYFLLTAHSRTPLLSSKLLVLSSVHGQGTAPRCHAKKYAALFYIPRGLVLVQAITYARSKGAAPRCHAKKYTALFYIPRGLVLVQAITFARRKGAQALCCPSAAYKRIHQKHSFCGTEIRLSVN